MKRLVVILCCIFVCGIMSAHAAKSFLKAQPFPKTFDDLSFADRMAILTEGFNQFETDFDENGRCISGCPYEGFTVEDQQALIERSEAQSKKLLEEAEAAEKAAQAAQAAQTAQNPQTATNTTQTTQNTNTNTSAVATNNTTKSETTPTPENTKSTGGERTCSVFLSENKPGTEGPRGEPLANCPRIGSVFGMRVHPIKGGYKMHNGVDLGQPTGTNVYATGDGEITVANTNEKADGCGKYIKIKHPNGMASLYCHLSELLVKVGDKVQSGCLIGKVGSTGMSTGPHLHYSVRAPDGGGVDPEKWMTCKHPHK